MSLNFELRALEAQLAGLSPTSRSGRANQAINQKREEIIGQINELREKAREDVTQPQNGNKLLPILIIAGVILLVA